MLEILKSLAFFIYSELRKIRVISDEFTTNKIIIVLVVIKYKMV